MLVALLDVLSPEIDKLFQGAPDLNEFAGILVFSRELNGFPIKVKIGNAALRNNWTAGISPSILKKVLNRIKRLDFHAPPAFLRSQRRVCGACVFCRDWSHFAECKAAK
jgi:hypothetical protein